MLSNHSTAMHIGFTTDVNAMNDRLPAKIESGREFLKGNALLLVIRPTKCALHSQALNIAEHALACWDAVHQLKKEVQWNNCIVSEAVPKHEFIQWLESIQVKTFDVVLLALLTDSVCDSSN